MKPFHHQAKGRPVAKRLSRARQVSILVYFFSEIATLDTRSATSAIGGLSVRMVGSIHLIIMTHGSISKGQLKSAIENKPVCW
jgi:hypothetical protein